jgi:hypothetical protein
MLTQRCPSLFSSLILAFGMTAAAQATLTDNGDGTVTQTRIDGSMLMWLKDSNYAQTSGYDTDGLMLWNEAQSWIASLNSANYLGYDDWRLPDALPVNGSAYDYSLSYDGSTDFAYNISTPGSAYPGSTENEMAYMFYYELGNLGPYDDAGNSQPNWGLTNTGLFTNLQPGHYWSDSECTGYGSYNAFFFHFNDGIQAMGYEYDTGHPGFAWAVRPAPEPSGILLLGMGLSGLTGLAGLRRWRGRR